MKSAVAITLIVCGTLLIAMPYIHNAFLMKQIADAMVALDKPVNLGGDMHRLAAAVCMFSGVIMVAVGAVAGLCTRRQPKTN